MAAGVICGNIRTVIALLAFVLHSLVRPLFNLVVHKGLYNRAERSWKLTLQTVM